MSLMNTEIKKGSKRKNQLFWVALLILQVSCILPSTVSCMDVSIVNDRITLHAVNEPLSSILAVLTKNNITVHIDPDINPLVTASFEKRPLHSALKSILQPYSFALTWKAKSGKNGKKLSLSEIQIFKTGSRAKMQYLKPENDFIVLENISTDERYVRGEVLIRIKDKESLQRLEKLLDEVQGRIVKENISSGLYRIQVPEDTDIYSLVAQINKEIDGAAEPNYVYALNSSINSGKPPVFDNRSDLIQLGKKANGTVAILDSGLTMGQGVEPFIVTSLNSFDTGVALTDTLGHGTQMAMLAIGMVTPVGGVEKDFENPVSIIPVKIFNDQGLTTNFTLIESVDFALKNNASIISLSWGTQTHSNFLEQTMRQADAAGVIVLAAVGNEPTGIPVYPAAYDSVVGVGALGLDGQPWENSNYGDFVNIYGPGMAEFPTYNGDSNVTQSYAGTSISTAYVAGVLSSFMAENPEATRDEVLSFLDAFQKKDKP